MRSRFAIATLAVLTSFLSFTLLRAATPPPPPDCKGLCPGSTCITSPVSAKAAVVPTAACPEFDEDQGGADIFSWNQFIALNWPAASNCGANTGKSILNVKSGAQGPVVWQTQMSSDGVFGGSSPAAWCSGTTLFGSTPRPFRHIAKAAPQAHLLGDRFAAIAEPSGPLQAAGGVLTDQSGRWVRYERLMNQTEYNYIVGQKLYTKAGLKGKTINLPTGSIELKASWKVLTPKELASGRYYTTVATVYNTPDGGKSPGKNPVTLGLVGLHIIQKTAAQTGFFWATFEQVDNDQVFFNKSSNTAPNTQTATKPYIELNANGTAHNLPVQVKRVTPIPASPQLNAYYQSLLSGSVFQYYRLVSTQWQTGGAPQGTPPNLANITLETYVQSLSTPNKQKPSNPPFTGCLACHANSVTSIGTNGDHSFLFLEAK